MLLDKKNESLPVSEVIEKYSQPEEETLQKTQRRKEGKDKNKKSSLWRYLKEFIFILELIKVLLELFS